METLSNSVFRSHTLWRVYVYPGSFRMCNVCRNYIHGDAYSTERPSSDENPHFIVHERCANLPEDITHPFHPHPLRLEPARMVIALCDICKGDYKFLYYCRDCHYQMDVVCASLTPLKEQQNLSNQDCSLIPCQGPDHFTYSCGLCNRLIQGLVYFDPKSSCLTHESCANLPEEINHSFHPSHLLTRVLRHPTGYERHKVICQACGRQSVDHYFGCSECEFYLDINCAFLVPTSKSTLESITHNHKHPLMKCDISKSVVISCSACRLLCRGSAYVCTECHIILDESCIKLPPRLQHPFDWRHPLVLIESPETSFQCTICCQSSKGYRYACLICDLVIGVGCVWPIPPTINSECHPHPLVFLEEPNENFLCNRCYRRCSSPFLCCLVCMYHVHLHCLPELPSNLKHDRHLHVLSLTDSPIKDIPDEDEDAELYCNACEHRRKLPDPTYYCEDCHFVAHVHCLTPQILSQLEISPTETIRKEEETEYSLANATTDMTNPVDDGQRIIDKLDSEIAELGEKIKEHEKLILSFRKQRDEKLKRAIRIGSVTGLKYPRYVQSVLNP